MSILTVDLEMYICTPSNHVDLFLVLLGFVVRVGHREELQYCKWLDRKDRNSFVWGQKSLLRLELTQPCCIFTAALPIARDTRIPWDLSCDSHSDVIYVSISNLLFAPADFIQ